MICEFTTTATGCACNRCGRKVRGHDGVGLIAECRKPCRYLGQPTAVQVTLVCISCGGTKKERSYEVHACQEFGECLPGYICTRESKVAVSEWMEKSGNAVEIQVCFNCPKYTPQ